MCSRRSAGDRMDRRAGGKLLTQTSADRWTAHDSNEHDSDECAHRASRRVQPTDSPCCCRTLTRRRSTPRRPTPSPRCPSDRAGRAAAGGDARGVDPEGLGVGSDPTDRRLGIAAGRIDREDLLCSVIGLRVDIDRGRQRAMVPYEAVVDRECDPPREAM